VTSLALGVVGSKPPEGLGVVVVVIVRAGELDSSWNCLRNLESSDQKSLMSGIE